TASTSPPSWPRPPRASASRSSSATVCNCSAPWATPGRTTSSSPRSAPRRGNCCSAAPTNIERRLRGTTVQLTFDSGVEAFRAELNAFLDEHLPDADGLERPHSSAHTPDWARRWQRIQFDHGWLLPGNPPEYGGRDAGIVEQYV